MKVTIKPWNGEPGFACLPLVQNIPEPRNYNWKKMQCPNCGAECWMTPAAKVAIKRSNGKLKGVCTECALKNGIGYKRVEIDVSHN